MIPPVLEMRNGARLCVDQDGKQVAAKLLRPFQWKLPYEVPLPLSLHHRSLRMSA